jgi:hypothetical protein
MIMNEVTAACEGILQDFFVTMCCPELRKLRLEALVEFET